MSTVLVVHHAPSPRLRRLLEAIETGLAHPELEGISVESVPALATTDDHVLRADGYVFLTPANFGYMSGALKHFFDRTYYPAQGDTEGLPYALFVHGDNDTSGAVRAVESITKGMGWVRHRPPAEVRGRPDVKAREACWELGAVTALAALERSEG